MIIPFFTEDVFHQYFRMTRTTFAKFITFCDTHLPETPENQLETKEKVYITLWYLANPCSYRVISFLFDRSISTSSRTVDNVTGIIEMHHHHFIKWPVANEIPAVSEEFKKLAGFPGATGAMDGTCRNIQAPEESK